MLPLLLEENPLVITGMGTVCGTGVGVDRLFEKVSAGQSVAAWLDSHVAPDGVQLAACHAPEPSDSGINRKMDRAVRLAADAAREAMRQAGLIRGEFDARRLGVIIGSSRGPLEKWDESLRRMGEGKRLLPSSSANSALASCSGALSLEFGARGPCLTVSGACASGAAAMIVGAEQILLDNADVMLVGGTEATLQPLIVRQLHAAGILGFDADPAQTCRPFDRRRNGMLLGDGAGCLVIESLSSARKRGAIPLARLRGWAMGAEAETRTGTDAGGENLRHIVRLSLGNSGLEPEAIDYLNLHGTGTRQNDLAEATAIRSVFSDSLAHLSLSSTKPITGHCLGASAALEAIICVEAIRHGVVPPTMNCDEPDPECGINVTPNIFAQRDIRVAMSLSAGFWGNQAALVIGRMK